MIAGLSAWEVWRDGVGLAALPIGAGLAAIGWAGGPGARGTTAGGMLLAVVGTRLLPPGLGRDILYAIPMVALPTLAALRRYPATLMAEAEMAGAGWGRRAWLGARLGWPGLAGGLGCWWLAGEVGLAAGMLAAGLALLIVPPARGCSGPDEKRRRWRGGLS